MDLVIQRILRMGYIRTMLFGRYAVGRVGSSRILTLPMVGSTSSTGPCARIDVHRPRAITTATATRTPRKRSATKVNSYISSAQHDARTPQMPSLSRPLNEPHPPARRNTGQVCSMMRERSVKHVNGWRDQSREMHLLSAISYFRETDFPGLIPGERLTQTP